MSDLIDRHTAIDAFDKQTWSDIDIPICKEIRSAVKKTIEQLPSAQPKRGEWIPCSERLPEEDGFYLATITDDGERFETAKMVYVGSEWIDTGFWEYEVVAWMPLPKPYCGADMREREGE